MSAIKSLLEQKFFLSSDSPILTDKAYDKMSDKYTFIPTYRILEDLYDLGWEPREIKESNTKKLEKRGYQKHMVRLSQKDNNESVLDQEQIFPEIVLFNSHGGDSSFILHPGFFRFICSNGLIVPAANDYGEYRIRHINYGYSDVEQAINNFLKDLPNFISQVELFQNTELDDVKVKKFGQIAAAKAWNVAEEKQDIFEQYVVHPNKVLRPRRKEDERLQNNLWGTYNIIQENITKGGLFTQKGKKTKPINSIDRLKSINKMLWETANNFVAV